MALPELPTQGQSPWFTTRNNWDLAVKSELEGRLSESELSATIARIAVRARGASETDDTAAINEALSTAASAGGGYIHVQSGRVLLTQGGHVFPGQIPVWFDGAGSRITHTGNNVCFDLNPSGDFNLRNPCGIVNIQLAGNAGASAVGVELGNAWGVKLSGEVAGYSNGVGVDLHNRTNWLEGLDVDGLKIDQCKTGMRFRRTTGTFSFGYTRIRRLAINVPANGIGIDFGADSATQVYFYNSVVEGNIWPLGQDSISVRVGPTFASDNVNCFVVGEVPGNATGTNHRGLVNQGGTVKFYGHFNIKDSPNDTEAGSTKIIPGASGVDSAMGSAGGTKFERWNVRNIDLNHSGSVGSAQGSEQDGVFVAGYLNGTVFRVLGIPSGGNAENAETLLSVTRTRVQLRNGPSLMAGAGNPEGAAFGEVGSVYLRSDGTSGNSLYIKTAGSGATNTGWTRAAFNLTGATASRPAAAVTQAGQMFFDTTLGKPVWRNPTNTAWVDATGAAA